VKSLKDALAAGHRKFGMVIRLARTAETVALAAAPSDDPMGCCTWTNSGGQLMMRNMKKSHCAKITGSTFEAGVKCNG